MKKLKSVLAALLVTASAFAVTATVAGCSKSSSSKAADDGNANITEINAQTKSLTERGFIMTPDFAARLDVPSSYTPDQLHALRNEMMKVSAHCTNVLNILSRHDISWAGNPQDLEDIRSAAETWIHRIDARLASRTR